MGLFPSGPCLLVELRVLEAVACAPSFLAAMRRLLLTGGASPLENIRQQDNQIVIKMLMTQQMVEHSPVNYNDHKNNLDYNK